MPIVCGSQRLGQRKRSLNANPGFFEDESPRVPIIYRRPLIFSASLNSPLAEGPISGMKGRESGAYEIKASGNTVMAYGLLFADGDFERLDGINHGEVCRIIRHLMHKKRDFGRLVLGGGYLVADYDGGELLVFGRSGDFGRLPDFMQAGAFQNCPLRTRLCGYQNPYAGPGARNFPGARDWFLSKGIEIE